MVYRCILPDWAASKNPSLSKVREGDFDSPTITELNHQGYNIYFLPNYPSVYEQGVTVDGSHIDTFNFVFIDMDLKDGVYPDKETFYDALNNTGFLEPSRIVDSGHGMHVYWQVADLDAMSFLRLQRRLMRKFKTDEAVAKIYQLMRVPGTMNTKKEGNQVKCQNVYETEAVYTCEELDKSLPPISHADEEYCKQHFNKTYRIGEPIKVNDKIPLKFAQLLSSNLEVKSIWAQNWSGTSDDRSGLDYKLGHIMLCHKFTKAEAMSVLVNSAKASTRAPAHRVSYAANIVDKIWAFEEAEDKESLTLSNNVKEYLQKSGEAVKGTRFACHRYIDATKHGFRLGQVIGLIAGSGVGKTALALDMFRGFVQNNPEYDHFFVPLEQPAHEIAARWATACGDNTSLHEKVNIISNYDEENKFRHLSFEDIKEYILKFQRVTGKKIGCVVIDHIGALRKNGKDGENQSLMDICHNMKSFALETNTMLIMQSQAPREKAGIGDLELNKDAAYGTVYFESYCDYVVTLWQPLKRCHQDKKCPTVTAFKFCKIRHKNAKLDELQEDVCYKLMFDPMNESFRELTQKEEESFKFWNQSATNLRKLDRKTDLVPYKSISWTKGVNNGEVNNSQNVSSATGTH